MPVVQIGFYQIARLALGRYAARDRPDIKRRMRPGRLREIFDDAGNVVAALDQQDIAGLDAGAQRRGIRRRERLVAIGRLLQIAGDQAADAIENPCHAAECA